MSLRASLILEETERRGFPKMYRRLLRDNFDTFVCISERHFKELYRLPKSLCMDLLNEVIPYLNVSFNNNAIPSHIKFLAALRFYTTGSFQRAVGQDNYNSLSQTSISRCVTEVTEALNKVAHVHVKFPTADEFMDIKNQFYVKYGFPGVVGLIDGTHIKISAPKKEVEHVYYCRKGGHSKNVMIICDPNYVILSANAGFGGTSHDAYVWRKSTACKKLRELHLSGVRNFHLLGDSGYPLQPWLMTPFGSPSSSAEEKYNRAHKLTRSAVERCIGVLKFRFRCLSKERVLFYEPKKAGLIINACVVLHNIMIRARVDMDDFEILDFDENDDETQSPAHESQDFLNVAKRTRDALVRSAFS